MSKKSFVVALLIALLVAGNVYWSYEYFLTLTDLSASRSALASQKMAAKTLDFTRLFIERVLGAEKGKEVDFGTRLLMENKVREIGDKQILVQWQKFTDSNTEAEAQEESVKLLEILIKKIQG